MDQPFSHPTGERLLSEVRSIFQNKPIFHRRDKPFVFVCGGSTKGRSRTLRRKFLEWAERSVRNVVFVLAEDAYDYTHLYDPPEVVNLSDFEGVIGEIADCVLVFPESAGSYAELGLFSSHQIISSKTLVVNPIAYASEESFVNLGPIATIDRSSFMRPSLPLASRKRTYNFSSIRTRLQRIVKTDRRKSFTYKPYRSLTKLEKFLVILELIHLFQFLTFEDLEKCLLWTFDSAVRKEIEPLLSVLLGMGFVQVKDRYYMLASGETSLLEIEDVRIEDLRVRVLGHYQKNCPALWRRYQKVRKC